MHLRYCCMTASINCGENRHAQIVMKELGIMYSHSTPQSIADQWWFWNCQNVPSELPKFLSELKLNPRDQVGRGLSQKEAEEIKRVANKERLQAMVAVLAAEVDYKGRDLTRPLNEREKAVLAPPHPADFGIPTEHWDAAKAYAMSFSENCVKAVRKEPGNIT